jgi:hypothetical protein
MSGGRATFAAKSGKHLHRQAGDICAVSPEGHALTDRYYIELKHRRSLDLEGFLVRGTGMLARFWRHTVTESHRYGRAPMMIVRQNFTPDLVLTTPKTTLPGAPIATVHHFAPNQCELRLLAALLREEFPRR